jgi:hypothetical protein
MVEASFLDTIAQMNQPDPSKFFLILASRQDLRVLEILQVLEHHNLVSTAQVSLANDLLGRKSNFHRVKETLLGNELRRSANYRPDFTLIGLENINQHSPTMQYSRDEQFSKVLILDELNKADYPEFAHSKVSFVIPGDYKTTNVVSRVLSEVGSKYNVVSALWSKWFSNKVKALAVLIMQKGAQVTSVKSVLLEYEPVPKEYKSIFYFLEKTAEKVTHSLIGFSAMFQELESLCKQIEELFKIEPEGISESQIVTETFTQDPLECDKILEFIQNDQDALCFIGTCIRRLLTGNEDLRSYVVFLKYLESIFNKETTEELLKKELVFFRKILENSQHASDWLWANAELKDRIGKPPNNPKAYDREWENGKGTSLEEIAFNSVPIIIPAIIHKRDFLEESLSSIDWFVQKAHMSSMCEFITKNWEEITEDVQELSTQSLLSEKIMLWHVKPITDLVDEQDIINPKFPDEIKEETDYTFLAAKPEFLAKNYYMPISKQCEDWSIDKTGLYKDKIQLEISSYPFKKEKISLDQISRDHINLRIANFCYHVLRGLSGGLKLQSHDEKTFSDVCIKFKKVPYMNSIFSKNCSKYVTYTRAQTLRNIFFKLEKYLHVRKDPNLAEKENNDMDEKFDDEMTMFQKYSILPGRLFKGKTGLEWNTSCGFINADRTFEKSDYQVKANITSIINNSVSPMKWEKYEISPDKIIRKGSSMKKILVSPRAIKDSQRFTKKENNLLSKRTSNFVYPIELLSSDYLSKLSDDMLSDESVKTCAKAITKSFFESNLYEQLYLNSHFAEGSMTSITNNNSWRVLTSPNPNIICLVQSVPKPGGETDSVSVFFEICKYSDLIDKYDCIVSDYSTIHDLGGLCLIEYKPHRLDSIRQDSIARSLESGFIYFASYVHAQATKAYSIIEKNATGFPNIQIKNDYITGEVAKNINSFCLDHKIYSHVYRLSYLLRRSGLALYDSLSNQIGLCLADKAEIDGYFKEKFLYQVDSLGDYSSFINLLAYFDTLQLEKDKQTLNDIEILQDGSLQGGLKRINAIDPVCGIPVTQYDALQNMTMVAKYSLPKDMSRNVSSDLKVWQVCMEFESEVDIDSNKVSAWELATYLLAQTSKRESKLFFNKDLMSSSIYNYFSSISIDMLRRLRWKLSTTGHLTDSIFSMKSMVHDKSVVSQPLIQPGEQSKNSKSSNMFMSLQKGGTYNYTVSAFVTDIKKQRKAEQAIPIWKQILRKKNPEQFYLDCETYVRGYDQASGLIASLENFIKTRSILLKSSQKQCKKLALMSPRLISVHKNTKFRPTRELGINFYKNLSAFDLNKYKSVLSTESTCRITSTRGFRYSSETVQSLFRQKYNINLELLNTSKVSEELPLLLSHLGFKPNDECKFFQVLERIVNSNLIKNIKVHIFPKGQATFTEREIYEVTPECRVMLVGQEILYSIVNSNDKNEMISEGGDSKVSLLAEMAQTYYKQKNAVALRTADIIRNNDMSLLPKGSKHRYQAAISLNVMATIDNSKWSARDNMVKFVYSYLYCPIISLVYALILVRCCVYYLKKTVVIPPKIIEEIITTKRGNYGFFSLLANNEGKIVRNTQVIAPNWLQGNMNSPSSFCHKLSMQNYGSAIDIVVNKYLHETYGRQLVLEPSIYQEKLNTSQTVLQFANSREGRYAQQNWVASKRLIDRGHYDFLVHSDDGAFVYTRSISFEPSSQVTEDERKLLRTKLEGFLFMLLQINSKQHAITTNIKKTYFKSTQIEFLSKVNQNAEQIGDWASPVVNACCERSHNGYIEDFLSGMSQMSEAIRRGAPRLLMAIVQLIHVYHCMHIYHLEPTRGNNYKLNKAHPLKNVPNIFDVPLTYGGGLYIPLTAIAMQLAPVWSYHMLTLEMRRLMLSMGVWDSNRSITENCTQNSSRVIPRMSISDQLLLKSFCYSELVAQNTSISPSKTPDLITLKPQFSLNSLKKSIWFKLFSMTFLREEKRKNKTPMFIEEQFDDLVSEDINASTNLRAIIGDYLLDDCLSDMTTFKQYILRHYLQFSDFNQLSKKCVETSSKKFIRSRILSAGMGYKLKKLNFDEEILDLCMEVMNPNYKKDEPVSSNMAYKRYSECIEELNLLFDSDRYFNINWMHLTETLLSDKLNNCRIISSLQLTGSLIKAGSQQIYKYISPLPKRQLTNKTNQVFINIVNPLSTWANSQIALPVDIAIVRKFLATSNLETQFLETSKQVQLEIDQKLSNDINIIQGVRTINNILRYTQQYAEKGRTPIMYYYSRSIKKHVSDNTAVTLSEECYSDMHIPEYRRSHNSNFWGGKNEDMSVYEDAIRVGSNAYIRVYRSLVELWGPQLTGEKLHEILENITLNDNFVVNQLIPGKASNLSLGNYVSTLDHLKDAKAISQLILGSEALMGSQLLTSNVGITFEELFQSAMREKHQAVKNLMPIALYAGYCTKPDVVNFVNTSNDVFSIWFQRELHRVKSPNEVRMFSNLRDNLVVGFKSSLWTSLLSINAQKNIVAFETEQFENLSKTVFDYSEDSSKLLEHMFLEVGLTKASLVKKIFGFKAKNPYNLLKLQTEDDFRVISQTPGVYLGIDMYGNLSQYFLVTPQKSYVFDSRRYKVFKICDFGGFNKNNIEKDSAFESLKHISDYVMAYSDTTKSIQSPTQVLVYVPQLPYFDSDHELKIPKSISNLLSITNDMSANLMLFPLFTVGFSKYSGEKHSEFNFQYRSIEQDKSKLSSSDISNYISTQNKSINELVLESSSYLEELDALKKLVSRRHYMPSTISTQQSAIRERAHKELINVYQFFKELKESKTVSYFSIEVNGFDLLSLIREQLSNDVVEKLMTDAGRYSVLKRIELHSQPNISIEFAPKQKGLKLSPDQTFKEMVEELTHTEPEIAKKYTKVIRDFQTWNSESTGEAAILSFKSLIDNISEIGIQWKTVPSIATLSRLTISVLSTMFFYQNTLILTTTNSIPKYLSSFMFDDIEIVSSTLDSWSTELSMNKDFSISETLPASIITGVSNQSIDKVLSSIEHVTSVDLVNSEVLDLGFDVQVTQSIAKLIILPSLILKEVMNKELVMVKTNYNSQWMLKPTITMSTTVLKQRLSNVLFGKLFDQTNVSQIFMGKPDLEDVLSLFEMMREDFPFETGADNLVTIGDLDHWEYKTLMRFALIMASTTIPRMCMFQIKRALKLSNIINSKFETMNENLYNIMEQVSIINSTQINNSTYYGYFETGLLNSHALSALYLNQVQIAYNGNIWDNQLNFWSLMPRDDEKIEELAHLMVSVQNNERLPRHSRSASRLVCNVLTLNALIQEIKQVIPVQEYQDTLSYDDFDSPKEDEENYFFM